jgi:hypothetical protein
MLKNKLLTLVAATILSLNAASVMAGERVSFGISYGSDSERGDFHERYEEDHHGFGGHEFGGHGYGFRGHSFHERYESGFPFYRSTFYQPPFFAPPSFYEPRRIVYLEQPRVIERQIILEAPETLRANPGRVISNNPYCREYQRDVVVGGQRQESYGTACRQPDGAWKIVNE